MSEKEQVEALKLLREWLTAARGSNPDGSQRADALSALITKTEKFLNLEAGPESHGSRRS